jgi:hypothetical protein
MNTEYKLSGKSGNIYLIGLTAGPILILLASILYGLIELYSPFEKLNIIALFGYAFSIVKVHDLIIRISKCRNQRDYYIIGTYLGIAAIYLNWVSFLYFGFKEINETIEFTRLLFHPSDVAKTVNLFAQSEDSRGPFIYLMESLIILGVGIYAGKFNAREKVFCESCNNWTEDINLNLNLEIHEGQNQAYTLESNLPELLEFKLADYDKIEIIRIESDDCPKCDDSSTLRIYRVLKSYNKKGELKEDKKVFSPIFCISSALLEKFIAKKNPDSKNTEHHIPSD